MGRTIADELRARWQTLLRLLQRRFGELPLEIAAAIEATTSVKQLNGWLDDVVTAARLADIDIR
jgi:hypothetical protein